MFTKISLETTNKRTALERQLFQVDLFLCVLHILPDDSWDWLQCACIPEQDKSVMENTLITSQFQ